MSKTLDREPRTMYLSRQPKSSYRYGPECEYYLYATKTGLHPVATFCVREFHFCTTVRLTPGEKRVPIRISIELAE